MKRQTIILILLSITFFQCTNNHKNIIISGTSINTPTDSLYLINNYGDTISTTVKNSDGKFYFEISEGQEDYYALNRRILYLKPGENLHILIDSTKFTFSGDGAERNQYIYKKQLFSYKRWSPYFGKLAITLFYRDSITNPNKEKVKTLVNESTFIKRELKELDYDYAKFLINRSYDLDSILIGDLKWARSIRTDNKIELNRSKVYIQLITQILPYKDTVSIEELNEIYSSIDHKNLQDEFVNNVGSPLRRLLMHGEDNYKYAMLVKEFYEINNINFTEYDLTILDFYQNRHDAEGKTASFSYEDINGNIINLSDFKGKYVYIDFWATWCFWCIKGFPYLDEVKKQFEGKDIEFVTISIDSEEKKNTWKNYVIKNKLEGIQLISPLKKGKTAKHTSYVDKGEIEDTFLTLLQVNDWNIGIPHYSLIGPDGKVVDATAPRPSNINIVDYLNRHLK